MPCEPNTLVNMLDVASKCTNADEIVVYGQNLITSTMQYPLGAAFIATSLTGLSLIVACNALSQHYNINKIPLMLRIGIAYLAPFCAGAIVYWIHVNNS